MEFNSLPLEVHLAIFSYLPVNEVMKIRLVCKQWNDLINCEFKFKRLQCAHQVLILSGRQPDDCYFESIRVFLDYVSHDVKFSRVKELDVNLWPKFEGLKDAFDFLNSFRFLEKLTACILVYDQSHPFHLPENFPPLGEVESQQFVVNLDGLKNAAFGLIFPSYPSYKSKVSVVLHLPSLLYLDLISESAITISHPHRLRTLAIDRLFLNRLDYSNFTSLVSLYTNATEVRSITANFIEKLPSLREIHLCSCNNIINLAEEKRCPLRSSSLDKAKLKIFFFEFEITLQQINRPDEQWPEHFEHFNFRQDSTQFLIRNRHNSPDNNRHIESIYYNVMANELSETEMFGMIFQKFPNIRKITLEGTVADKSRLLKFIDKFKIGQLFLQETSLPQSFLENLAQSCSSIRRLHVLQQTMDILSGDFDFIFKFENLSILYISNSLLSLNFVASALKELKKLDDLTFDHPNFHFWLRAYDDMIKIHLDVFELNGLNPIEFDRKYVKYKVCHREAYDFVRALSRHLNADGFVTNIKELLALLCHHKFEQKNGLFMMRRYIYDQQHCICFSEEQMRQLNFCTGAQR